MGTFVYNTGKAEPPKDEQWKEFGFFFDGTLNNKDNIDLREKVKNKKASPAEIAAYTAGSKRDFWDEQGTDNSYSNSADYSNVARLWKYCEQINYAIYIEGIGTLSKQRDDDDGFMFGAGKAGIRMKVRKACEELAKKIDAVKRKLPKQIKIPQITVDVFGFSRGAAAARNFIHEINVKESYKATAYEAYLKREAYDKQQQEKQERERRELAIAKQDDLKRKSFFITPASPDVFDSDGEKVQPHILKNGILPAKGHLGYLLLQNGFTFEEIEKLDVFVRFVGLYDTVSSYYKEASLTKFTAEQLQDSGEGNKYFADDVEELNLNRLHPVQKIVHFTAMDEHRYNFALTKLPGALEKQFPGVHSDIGGSYVTETETVDQIEIGFAPSILHSLELIGIPILKLQFITHLLKRGYSGLNVKEQLEKYAESLVNDCWYKKEQLAVKNETIIKAKGESFSIPLSLYYKLRGERYIKKEYSYIPLLFMNEHFKKILSTTYIKVVSDELTFKKVFSVEAIAVLKKAKDHLEPYVMGEKGGRPWHFVDKEHLKLKKQTLENNKKKIFEKIKEAQKTNKHDYEAPVKLDDNLFAKRAGEMDTRHHKMVNAQDVLEILRNEYLHWSANKEWFGMNPTKSRVREKH